MTNNVYVDSEQLKSIANSLKTKSNSIMNRYQTDCSSALKMGAECIKLSGLDTVELENSLSSVYKQLVERLNNLSDFLIKTSSQYETVNQTITNNFNSNLKNELSALLGNGVAKEIPTLPKENPGAVIEVPKDMTVPKTTEIM